MVDDRIIVFGIVLIVFGIIGLLVGFLGLKKKRIIENTPTSKIRSLAMGLVEIYGSVDPIKWKLLKSPLTNKDCVYYNFIVEEKRSTGKNSHWITVFSGVESSLFHLKDDTGSVTINLEGAQIDVPSVFDYTSSFGRDPPQEVQKFLKTKNIKFENFLGMNKTMRFKEYIINPEDKLYIMGTAADNPYVDDKYSEKNSDNIMIKKDDSTSFYYVSNKSEKEILKSINWRVFGGLIAGLVLTIGGVVLIVLGG